MKPVALGILHITLKFLGDTEEAALPGLKGAMERAAGGGGPILLTLRGAGAFPRVSNPRVVWVGVEDGGRLKAMATSLEEDCAELGFRREERAFSPHLTLARMRSPRGREKVTHFLRQHLTAEFGEARVEKIVLKRSVLRPQGPEYQELLSVPLGLPDGLR